MDPAVIAILAFIIISSLTFHEAAHAVAATACGDDLAKSQGRVTLNPLSHIDLFGTIVLPILMYVTTGLAFAYARPVPFRPENFKNPRRDTFLVAMAGPAANVALATVFFVTGLIFSYAVGGRDHMPDLVFAFFYLAILLNCALFIFNMIPIPPLDGHYVLDLFLPERGRQLMRSIGIFGILIVFYVSGPILDAVLPPLHNFIVSSFGGGVRTP